MTDARAIEYRPAAVAPWRHTGVLLLILLAVALRGALLQRAAPAVPSARAGAVPAYLGLIAAECALLYLVARGIRRTGTTLRDLVGDAPRDVTAVLRDVGLGLACWALVTAIAGAWEHVARDAAPARVVAALLPRTAGERALWVLLSVAAGVAEEIVFRGYLQRQFAAWTGSPWAALALQAVLFGVTHGYQGLAACVRITVYGALFGGLALWRRSLRPGIVAHVWTDLASGLLRA